MNAIFVNDAHTIGNLIDGERVTVVERDLPGWEEFLALNPAPFIGRSQEAILADERAQMVVSRFQARAALYQAGLLSVIETLLAGESNFIHRLAWDESTEFHRDSPTLTFLGGAAGLSDEQIDDLFRLAMTIRA